MEENDNNTSVDNNSDGNEAAHGSYTFRPEGNDIPKLKSRIRLSLPGYEDVQGISESDIL